jgi:hypothetical protein
LQARLSQLVMPILPVLGALSVQLPMLLFEPRLCLPLPVRHGRLLDCMLMSIHRVVVGVRGYLLQTERKVRAIGVRLTSAAGLGAAVDLAPHLDKVCRVLGVAAAANEVAETVVVQAMAPVTIADDAADGLQRVKATHAAIILRLHFLHPSAQPFGSVYLGSCCARARAPEQFPVLYLKKQ